MSTIKVNTITNVSGSVDTGVALSVPLKILETAAPSSTAANYGYIYCKTDGKLYFDSDNISEVELSGSGVSVSTANTFTRGQVIDGGQNEVQLQIQAQATDQAANLKPPATVKRGQA